MSAEHPDLVTSTVEGTSAGSAGPAILRADAITAGYGAGAVITDVSVQVAPGEIACVLGANGSGKSTLLKAVVGILPRMAGRVVLRDRDVTHHASEDLARLGVGFVPQVDDVFAPLTVRENLEMGGYLLPTRQLPARIERVLETFPRLSSMLNRTAARLSGGERKMLAMGRVLMLEPAVFLLDEPTANLAPAVATSLLEHHVRGLATTGAGVLIVEQRVRAALAISDRAYVLAGGRLHAEGTPARLTASPDFAATLLGAAREPHRRDPTGH